MSSSTIRERAPSRGSSSERERAGLVVEPGKQTRSAEGAPSEGGATPGSAFRGNAGNAVGAEPGATDWSMSAGLSTAFGIEVGGAASGGGNDAQVVRRKAVAAPSWAGAAGADASASAARGSNAGELDVARAGLSGAPAASFPHRDAIERSFGTSLPATAHTDEAAVSASKQLGADGYALGSQVAFASSSPSLALAAHEAAHVMQATSGVQMHGGDGGSDAYEAHADAVADRVVRGESARELLAVGPVAAPAVRRGKDDKPQNQPGAKAASDVEQLKKDLQALIDGAVWKEIRKTAYPKESAAGIKRAKERKDGKRPDLTGLGKITALEHFAAAVKAVQKDWAAKGAADRLKAVAAAINDELALADVPKFLEVKAIPMEFKGSFAHSLWRFNLSKEMVDKPALSDADAAELCNTALHEARHAEQAFLGARFAAGAPNNKDADAIVAEQHLPKVIAEAAVAKKFDAGTDPKVAALGAEMYKANVTDGAANQQISDDDYLTEMKDKRDEAKAALAALKLKADAGTISTATTKRDELKAAIAEVERRYTLYRNIPYEADAHEVGDAAEQAFKGWP